MDRIDVHRLYVIGSELHPLMSISSSDTTVGDLFSPLLSADRSVNELLSVEGPVRLDFSRPSAEKLRAVINDLISEYYRGQEGTLTFKLTYDTKIASWRLWTLKNSIQAFETVFQTDMQRAATYLVPKRGTYELGDLVDRASDTFPCELRGTIGEQALAEYNAAGRCYAFGLFTAAGYHCCRAAEAVLRLYYRSLTNSLDSGNETWGALIGLLEKVSGDKRPDSKTLGHIKHLKDYERNPLSHLRAVLSSTDADILLSGAKVAIAAMAVELLKKNAEAEPTLALVSTDEKTG